MNRTNMAEEHSINHSGFNEIFSDPAIQNQRTDNKSGLSNRSRQKKKIDQSTVKPQLNKPKNYNLPGTEKIRTRVVTW